MPIPNGFEVRRFLYTRPWLPWYMPVAISILYALLLCTTGIVRGTPPVVPLHPGYLFLFVVGTVHCIRRLYVSPSMYFITVWAIVLFLLTFIHYIMVYATNVLWSHIAMLFVAADLPLAAALLNFPSMHVSQASLLQFSTCLLPAVLVPQLTSLGLVLVSWL